MNPSTFTHSHGRQRGRRRETNSIMRQAFSLFWIGASLTKMNYAPVAIAFGFQTLPVTQHSHSFKFHRRNCNLIWDSSMLSKRTRVHMEPTNNGKSRDESAPNNESKRKRFGQRTPRKRKKLIAMNENENPDESVDGMDENDEDSQTSSSSSSMKHPRAKMKKLSSSAYSALLPPPAIGKGSISRQWEGTSTQPNGGSRSPGAASNKKGTSQGLRDTTDALSNATPKRVKQSKADEKSEGASTSDAASSSKKKNDLSSSPPFSSSSVNARFLSSKQSSYLPPPSLKVAGGENAELPEWGSLFVNPAPSQYDASSGFLSVPPTAFPTPAIEGVLPVSELFYRSTQSLSSSVGDDGEEAGDESSNRTTNTRKRAKAYKEAKADIALGDDEELPFSAEQSDSLSTPGNKIHIRRNKAVDSSLLLDEIATGIGMGMDGNQTPSEAVQRELTSMARQEQEEQRQLNRRTKQQQNTLPTQDKGTLESTVDEIDTDDKPASELSSKSAKLNKKKTKLLKGERVPGRKMVRRGMEMLVGGEPINADPPQRAIELNYFNKHPRLWHRAITLNSPDFGPLLHMHSAGKISKFEIGLYCENFFHMAQKWNICPEDLKFVVNEHELRNRNDNAVAEHAFAVGTNLQEGNVGSPVLKDDVKSIIQALASEELGLELNIDKGIIQDGLGRTIMFNAHELQAPKGFGTPPRQKKRKRDSRGGSSGIVSDKSLSPVHSLDKSGAIERDPILESVSEDSKLMFTLGGELKFS
eukprot:CCRYP_009886-RA/>CCRYP_009886-RA protein AED:0.01 eAED:0.01 QI:492/1/1/1/1/1/3/1511/754